MRSCGYTTTLMGRRRYYSRINERASKDARSARAQVGTIAFPLRAFTTPPSLVHRMIPPRVPNAAVAWTVPGCLDPCAAL